MFGISLSQLFIVAILVLTLVYLWSRQKNLPPGPWGLPYIGYVPWLFYIMSYTEEPIHVHFVRLGKRYGKMYSFTVFGIPFIIMNDHKVMKEAFSDLRLNDRGENKMLIQAFSHTVNTLSDVYPYRKFLLSSFRRFGKKSLEETITTEVTLMIEELLKVNDKPIDINRYIGHAVTNIISKIVIGQRFEATDERVQRLRRNNARLVELMGEGNLNLYVPFDITPKEKKQEYDRVTRELVDFFDNMVEERRKIFDPNNLNDLLDTWLNELQLHESDQKGSYLNPKNMSPLILLLYTGATDALVNSFDWALQFLVKYPDVQSRLQRELDTVVGRNRLPTMADKPNLPYLDAFLLEIQRFVVLTPLGGIHVAGDTVSIQGYTIPKNSVVISNLYAVMHDPEIWKDPHVFRPDRFIDDSGNMCVPDEAIYFGVGRRICIGESLAKQELFLLLGQFLHQLSLDRPHEGAPLPTFKPIFGLITSPEPYEMRITKRE